MGGVIHEYVSAFGITAQMTGQLQNSATVPLPGGVEGLYAGAVLQRFRYPDWQGTIRAESHASPIGFPSRVFTESLAFDPFGNRYAVMGAPFNVDTFTGKPDQIVSDEYDFPAREEHNGQGRWISPDPMRGTGNKYVYANNNPLSMVDPYGLEAVIINGIDYGGSDAEFGGSKFLNPLADSESHESTSTQTPAQPSPNQPQGQTDPPPTIGNQVNAQATNAQHQGQPQNQDNCNEQCTFLAAGQKGERGKAGKAEGTDNPFKKAEP
ncbi:MAG: RHS repeat-associated core domain-containing protein [Terriglobales bacterium]